MEGLWVDSGTNTDIVLEIARRWNAALATGKYDHLFQKVTGRDQSTT